MSRSRTSSIQRLVNRGEPVHEDIQLQDRTPSNKEELPRVVFSDDQRARGKEQSTLSPKNTLSPQTSSHTSRRLVTAHDGITPYKAPGGNDDEELANQDVPHHSFFSFHKRRRKTHLTNAPKENHYISHKFYIRRPRALQYFYHGELIEAGDTPYSENSSEVPSRKVSRSISRETEDSDEEEDAEQRSTETVHKSRERLELFIDLLFVGIISNISENFFDQAFIPNAKVGDAVYEFLLLFFPTFRLWAILQNFLSSYFLDDALQRLLLVWILILGLVWGNNAPTLLKKTTEVDPKSNLGKVSDSYILVAWLVAILSILIAEAVYSIWIPWLRRYCIFAFVISIGTIGLWIGAVFTTPSIQGYFLLAAIISDYLKWTMLESPIGDKVLGPGYKKAADWKHVRGRWENFFIIVLGEGVFLLIRGSPAGQGFTTQLAAAIQGLLLYYPIHWLYFSGDQARTFVHAKNRRWYIRSAWQAVHTVLYCNLVLLSSAVLYLVGYTTEPPPSSSNTPSTTPRPRGVAPPYPETSEGEPLSENNPTLNIAAKTLFVTLSLILFSELILALLNRPLDPPNTLVINNRYLRMAPRGAAAIACAALVTHTWKIVHAPLAIALIMCWVVLNWEWGAGMERDGGFIEGVKWTYFSQEAKEQEREEQRQEQQTEAK